jgi:hypothetical protein
MKYIWKHKRPRTAKAILSKKFNAGGITVPDFKPYYRTTTIKTARYWHKKQTRRPTDQNKDPYISPHIYT